jgi:hypothetical protein
MTDTPNLTSPRLRMVMADGAVHEVQTLNPDLVRFDITRSKHGWPEGQAAPFLWLTFIGWAALRREHTIPDDVTWEAFQGGLCIDVEALADEGGEGPGSPTLPGAEPG